MTDSNDKLTKNYIFEFLASRALATLATVSKGGTPDISPIYCLIQSNFDLLFTTRKANQKYKNILTNHHVAIAVTKEDSKETAIIWGTVSDAGTAGLKQFFEDLSVKFHEGAGFDTIVPILKRANGDLVLMRVRPSKIRMSRYHENGYDEKIVTPPQFA